MRNALFVSVIAIASVAMSSPAYADCKCKLAKAENGWCGDCNVGYVAGVKIPSKKLYDAVAGKPIADASKIKCQSCRVAFEKDGACSHCGVAFADNKKYKSAVGQRLAAGKARNPAAMKCSQCRVAAKDHGWCDHCQAGQVGHFRFKDKKAYDQAVEARKRLREAVKLAKKCETCAVAMVTDGTCATCKVTFKDGKKMVKSEKREAKPAERP